MIHLNCQQSFKYLSKKVAELQKYKQKVVIWTNFVGTIEKLENHFNKKLGMYCRSIYGKTPIEQSTIADEKDKRRNKRRVCKLEKRVLTF